MLWKRKEKVQEAEQVNKQEIDQSSLDSLALIPQILDALTKIEKTQKETSLQLEDLDELLQESKEVQEKSPMIDLDCAMLLCDVVYEFYDFARDCSSLDLDNQAKMMFNRSKKIAQAYGLEIIHEETVLFNEMLYTAKETVNLDGVLDLLIVKVLKCGYLHENKVIKKATAVVNKK